MLPRILQKILFTCALLAPFDPVFAQDLPLQPGDVIEVGIFGRDDLSGERRVDGSGRVLIPTLGRIEASGLMPDMFETRVTDALETAQLVAQPIVWIDVLRRGDVFVDGDVPTPGAYRWRPGMTVRQAVALAGGSRISNTSELGDALRAINATEALQSLETRIASLRAQEARLLAEIEFADLYGPNPTAPVYLRGDALPDGAAPNSDTFRALRRDQGRLRLIRFPDDIAANAEMADIRRTQEDLLENRVAINLATVNSLQLGITALQEKADLLDQELAYVSTTVDQVKGRLDELLTLKASGLVRSQVVLDLQTAFSQANTTRIAILSEQADTKIEIQQRQLTLANYRDTIRQDAAIGLQTLRAELSVARARLEPVRRAAALAGSQGLAPVALDSDQMELHITLISADGADSQVVTMNNPVLPGQSLTITRITPGNSDGN